MTALAAHDQIDSGRRPYWNIGKLRPAQNLVDDVGDAPELVRNVWSIEYQTARFNVLPNAVHRRQSHAHGQDFRLVSQLKPRARKPRLAKPSQRLTTAEAEIIRKPAERAAHFTIAREPQV
jgi:hypothetical protein